MATVVISTPRPPLNLFEVERKPLTDEWQTIYNVPTYRIPPSGPTAERFIECAALMTGVLVCPPANTSVKFSMRVLGENEVDTYPLLDGAFTPSGDFLSIDLNRQVLRTGEKLQMKVDENQTATVHFSFILNQREEYTVIL